MVPGTVCGMCDKAIERGVEALCRKGCAAVREDIRLLEQGMLVPELRGLGAPDRLAVLRELRAIMAVYGERCSLGETKSDKT